MAGGVAASTLREEGFDGRIVLVGAEPLPPYERPPLSKEYLRDGGPAEKTYFQPLSWYEQNQVELRLGVTATALDLQAREVELDGGERLSFERLLLATGGRNRSLPLPGRDLEGVFDLRTLEDADRIRKEASAGASVLIVGAGFIGCELASSFRQMGVEVDVVEVFETTLEAALGPRMGKVMESIHRDHGVRFHFGHALERFEGDGRVEAAITNRGSRIDCDLAIVAVGIRPATELVEETDIEVDNGTLVDAMCETNVEGVFAAGDVANHDHPIFGRIRVEHWDNAMKQGAAAARNMLGRGEAYSHPHWFWSDQYEHNLQSMGHSSGDEEMIVRGSIEDRSFAAFFVKEGVVRSVIGLDRGRDVRRSAGLISSGHPVDPAALRDEEVDLRKLAASREEERVEGVTP